MSRPGSPETPEKLRRDHTVAGFDCGAHELDDWLVRFAFENQQANNATTYVTSFGLRVVGYYAIAMAAVTRESAPERLAKGRPSRIPCVLMGRLAVDRSVQGHGVGAGLLRDALQRSLLLRTTIGAAAVLVHARDDEARAFYLANGDFIPSPVDTLQLLVPIKALRRVFGSG